MCKKDLLSPSRHLPYNRLDCEFAFAPPSKSERDMQAIVKRLGGRSHHAADQVDE